MPDPPAEVRPAEPEADPAVEEVNIRGARGAVVPNVSSMNMTEVRSMPGAFGDPFRAIDALPGVTPTVSGFPYFFVRGAPPGNVVYEVDGVRVPYLFHFGLGPSVVHPASVERVDLYSGALPAHFGSTAGAVIAGETKAPKDRAWGEVNVRAVDAGAILELPFAEGRGHVLFGGRYSYTAALLSLVQNDVKLDYRDYNARLTYDVSANDRLTLFSFGSYDLAGQNDNGAQSVLFASEFYRADLRWDRTWSENTRTRVAFFGGVDRTRLDSARFSRAYPVGPRAEIVTRLSKMIQVRAGAQGTFTRYDADLPSPYALSKKDYEETSRFFASRTDSWMGAYVDMPLTLPCGVEIVPGVRADRFTSLEHIAYSVDPRVSASMPIGRAFRFVTSHGTAHQPAASPIPVPAVQPPGLPHDLQKVWQSTAGVEKAFTDDLFGTLTLFRNSFEHVGDLFAVGSKGPLGYEVQSLSGRAYGAEMLVRGKITRRLSGLASYTLARNERIVDGKPVPNGFDRTHVANLALSFEPAAGWRLGGRLLVYTGAPTFATTAATTMVNPKDPAAPASTTENPGERLPTFTRIDLRFEKRWNYSAGWISFIAEVLNATAGRETLRYTCDDRTGCKAERFGPVVIPSVGIEGGF